MPDNVESKTCKRTFIFGVAPGVFVTVRMTGPRPIEEEPDPVPEKAHHEALQASLRMRGDKRNQDTATAHRRLQPEQFQGDPLWFDPPIWVDSTSELSAIKKKKAVDTQTQPQV